VRSGEIGKHMPTPQQLDLTQVPMLAEIIIRGGDLHDASANVKQILQNNYQVLSTRYGIRGLSVLINATTQQQASYNMLAQRNPIFNRKLSLSVIGAVKMALKHAGFGVIIIIYVTPSHDLPDHHTLAVYDVDPLDEQDKPLSTVHRHLPDNAAKAIIIAFNQVVDNPYPKQRP